MRHLKLDTRRSPNAQRGLALMSVLTTLFVLVVLGALILYLSGKEIALSASRLGGARSLNLAEGGAFAARSTLMAFMGADPLGAATIDSSLTGTNTVNWWYSGSANGQNPMGLLDYIVLDGQRFSLGATPSMKSVTFYVNWVLPYSHLKLQTTGPVTNTLGSGSYTATVVLAARLASHSSCTDGPTCYIFRLSGVGGLESYQFNYSYTITTTGTVGMSRRQVVLTGDFSVILQRQNFARYALFTNSHTDPSTGSIVYFNRTGEFDGPVHTNGEFGFREFPKFGQGDPNSPCNTSRIQSTPITSVSTYANFYNNGSTRRIQANENVVSGVRRDAPVLPDCTAVQTDDGDNPAANFTRGVSNIALPGNNYSQKRAAIGGDPGDTSSVTNLQIRQAVPELVDNTSSVPNGIYVPVVDSNGNSVSNAGEPMGGGIYVQGTLDSLALSVNGSLAVYTLRQGTQTVTVTVDRNLNSTTVTNTSWSSPQTRTFAGVPKGWQSYGNDNASIIYVEGDVTAISGTLEQKEQTTVVASGNITITNHLVYQDPPVTTDPTDNPLNVLGLFTPRDIIIGTSAPNDLNIHATLMAGVSGDTYQAGVKVTNYNDATRGSRGSVYLIGGVIEKYYPPFGTLNADGSRRSGYGREFTYDRRMSRGYSPPYFPTTTSFELAQGSPPLAGTRPVWREAAP